MAIPPLSQRELATLGRVSSAVDLTQEDAGFERSLEALCRSLGALAGRVFVVEPRGGDLLLFAQYGEPEAPTRLRRAPAVVGQRHFLSTPIPGRDRELGRLLLRWQGEPRGARLMEHVARTLGIALQARSGGVRTEIRRTLGATEAPGYLDTLLEALQAQVSAEAGELRFWGPGAETATQVSTGRVDVGCPYSSDTRQCPVVAGGHGGLLEAGRGSGPAHCRGAEPGGDHVCLPLVVDGAPRGSVLLNLGPEAPREPTRVLLPLLEAVDEAAAQIAERLDQHFPEPAPRGVVVRCLGPLEVLDAGQLVPLSRVKRSKAWDLLKLLALRIGSTVSQDELVESLWPGAEPKAGANRLHGLVHSLRRALEPGAGELPRVLRQSSGYLLDSVHVRTDVSEFQSWVGEARRAERRHDDPLAIAAYGEAIDLYRGDLFQDDPLCDWFRAERQWLKQQFLYACERLAELSLLRGEGGDAAAALQRAVAIDPYREDLQRELVRRLLALGRRSEAREHLLRCFDAVREGLDTEPERETLALRQLVGDEQQG